MSGGIWRRDRGVGHIRACRGAATPGVAACAGVTDPFVIHALRHATDTRFGVAPSRRVTLVRRRDPYLPHHGVVIGLSFAATRQRRISAKQNHGSDARTLSVSR